jgi:uncharacterized membrane protein
MIGEIVVLLVVLALLGGLLVLPILALVRTWGLSRLRQRVDDLEEDVARLRHRLRTLAAAPLREALPEEPPLEPEAIPAEVLEQPTRVARPAEPERQSARRRLPSKPRVESPDAATLENWLGKQGLGWAAVVLLLFATAFFLKYAFENAWIGEMGRVTLGIVAAAGLCVGGYVCHQARRWLFGQMLTAAGVSLLYLTTFSAFGYYHLIPQERAAVYLVVVVLEAAGLALLYQAPAIALMAVVGGLLTPILLHADQDRYVGLFLYLGLLDVGVVLLTLARSWGVRRGVWGAKTEEPSTPTLPHDSRPTPHAARAWELVAPVALLGTQGLFWLWYATWYHPEKLGAALLFQGAIFGLFLLHDLLATGLSGQRASWLVLVDVVLEPLLFATAGYVLLDEDFHAWLAPLAVGMAIVYTALAWWLLNWKRADQRLVLVVVAIGMGFVAIALGLRGEAGWVALGWAVQGVALSIFGMRIRSVPLRGMGAVFLTLAVGRLVFVDTPWGGREPFVFLFNSYGLPGLTIAGCLLGAAAFSRRWLTGPDPLNEAGRWLAGLGGAVLLWFVLSFEVYQSVAPHRYAWADPTGDPTRLASMCLSVFWAVYAAVVLGVGFWLASRPVRSIALGLFALTMAKVVLIDMAGLPGIYRVAAFFVLAVMMGIGAWVYQRAGGLDEAVNPEKGEAKEEVGV